MVPESKVARRLGVTLARLQAVRDEIETQGFPPRDPVLGTTSLQAVDDWIAQRTGLKPRGQKTSPVADMQRAIGDREWRS